MHKRGTVTPRVQQMLELLKAGQSRRTIAAAVGVTVGAVKEIARCYAVSTPTTGRPGRPQLATPLTLEQQAMAEAHMKYARGVARRCLREFSTRQDEEFADYISLAYLGLVKAASRWDGRGRFKSFLAKYVEGTIRDARRIDMQANGWIREREGGMRQVLRPCRWPHHRKTGAPVTPTLAVNAMDEYGTSCLQLFGGVAVSERTERA